MEIEVFSYNNFEVQSSQLICLLFRFALLSLLFIFFKGKWNMPEQHLETLPIFQGHFWGILARTKQKWTIFELPIPSLMNELVLSFSNQLNNLM